MHELTELVACGVEFLDEAKGNEEVTKEDVISGMRERLCVIMGKLVSFPTVTNFSLPCQEPPSTGGCDNEAVNAFFEQ